MRLLPFLDAGEFPQNLKIDDEGVRYDDALGRDIHCPIDGGVWLLGVQVSGTCDRPYRYTLASALKYQGVLV